MSRKSKHHTSRPRKSAAQPRTINQLRADERRDVDKRLKDLVESLDSHIPEGWRADTLSALMCITHNGHEFARACAYAAILRGNFGQLKSDFWLFIDQHHGAFARFTDAETLARWQTSKHAELVKAAAIEKAREKAAEDVRLAAKRAGAR